MSSFASVTDFIQNLAMHLPIILAAVVFVNLVGPNDRRDESHDSDLEGSDHEDSSFMQVMNS